MQKNFLWVVIFSLFSVIAGVGMYQAIFGKKEFISVQSNQKITPWRFNDIVLNDLNNQPKYLKQWQQPVLIINLWAPWCAPCRREIPALVDIQKRYSDNVQILGLSFDTLANVQSFSSEYEINYPLLLVSQEISQINHFFGNNNGGLPFTAILDANRKLHFTHSGEITTSMLETQLKALK